MKDNAKDICVAEAKAARTRTEVDAEAVYKGTPKAREHAVKEIAEADYKVAKERCDDKAGNEKDVCVKVARAAMTKIKADAKAARVSTDAKVDASKDKRGGRLQGRRREVRRHERRREERLRQAGEGEVRDVRGRQPRARRRSRKSSRSWPQNISPNAT